MMVMAHQQALALVSQYKLKLAIGCAKVVRLRDKKMYVFLVGHYLEKIMKIGQ
jgi:hypothetical protein